MWACHTLFFAGLPFGRAIGWIGQTRDDHAIPWSTALRQLWPQTLLGATCLAAIGALRIRAALPYVFVLLAGGLVLAVPFCVVTSWPRTGRGADRAPASAACPRRRRHPTSLKQASICRH